MIVLDAKRVTVLILIGAIAALVSLHAHANPNATMTPLVIVQ